MSVTVLTVEQVAEHKQEWSDSYTFIGLLCDSHEALRAALAAERADADRLAEALRECPGGSQAKREALAAHDAWKGGTV